MRSGRHRRGRKSTPVTAAAGLVGLTAVALAVGMAPGAVAAPATPQIAPSAPDAKPFSAGSGGNSGSFDNDSYDDLLARNKNTGVLNVYKHRGQLNGTSTFDKPARILGDSRTFRWIGQGDFNGDGFADVAGITRSDGRLLIALNRGEGELDTTLLDPGYTSSFGWNSTDLVFTGDVDGDGADDIMARKKGTNSTFAYVNNGNQDKPGFKSPALLAQTSSGVIDQQLADITGDTVPDLLSIKSNGELHLRDYTAGPPPEDDEPPAGQSYLVGTGFNSNNAFVLNDVNIDDTPDLVGRAADGTLRAYITGVWNPQQPRPLFTSPPVVLGGGWNNNDVIS